jgi:GT2 family glycosyltransferase
VAGLRRQAPAIGQIIVVDDHSRDDTAKVGSDLGCEVIRHERIRGLAATRNSGLSAANGDLIIYVDADVALADDWLAVLLPLVGKAGVATAGGVLIERNQKTPPDAWRTRYMGQSHGPGAMTFEPHQGRWLAGFAILAHRSILVAAGGYDTRYGRSYEDVDLSLRLLAEGYCLEYEPAAVAYHQRTDSRRSLMASCWSWDHWPEYNAGTYHSAWRLIGKLARNVSEGVQLAVQHTSRRDCRLIPVDFTMIRLFSWWDVRYFLSNCNWIPAVLRPRDADLGNIGRP